MVLILGEGIGNDMNWTEYGALTTTCSVKTSVRKENAETSRDVGLQINGGENETRSK
jgi:hypothetical protein